LKVFEQLPFETIAKQHFVHPLKSVNIGRALLETSNCENLLKILLLKIDYSGRNFNIVEKGKKNANGECRKNFNDIVRFLVEHYPNVGFTKCKVKRVVNLFEDTGSVRELNYLAKISRSCFSPLWKN
jgi:hypothetical protein